jgi:hypothetical protein
MAILIILDTGPRANLNDLFLIKQQQFITEIDTRNQQTAGILGTTGCPGSSMIVQGESPIQEALDRNRNLTRGFVVEVPVL